ncbi:response regulator transcription factor [Dechloromonas sp.]|uniref:response regulator transcription factor n=1 Tax=Dechloromonas sp. TaxID=1917218 RepID=UPI001228B0A7|nr:response regulator [Dechloromonas sp.]MBU3697459.1 response regulator transcription factor [Dechloromonas sp.]TEX47144.1 MAG: DNA-binding response regulator [Rhodocyclaceae bacterium]
MSQALAHLVDDDDAIRDALAWLLKTRGIASAGYASAEEFLDRWTPELAGCVVLDMRMGGMTGLDCFDRLCERQSTLPVIFLTGHGDVPMAVGALKKGAFDFFEKPVNDNDLAERVAQALAQHAQQRQASAAVDSVKSRISRLTSRERQIMELVLAGKYNKVIADELNISMRTVEVHRANLFDKMQVKTAVELANLLKAGG